MSNSASLSRQAPLDEVMLAMDVVDTLRHRQRVVERELDSDNRDEELLEKLRRIYRTQGIEVPDHVLKEGVRALREDRFSYHAAGNPLARRLALLYVSRGRWGKKLLALIVVLCLAGVLYFFFIAGPKSNLPDTLKSSFEVTWHTAKTDRARNLAKQIYDGAAVSIQSGDTKEMKKALAALAFLREQLNREYVLTIVNSPNEKSGIWRVPDINTSARNYYIIVEALDENGKPVAVPVINEETGKKEVASTWGLRVGEDVFQAVARDKKDDGIIQNNIFGKKKKGFLQPEYNMPTSGAAITSW